MRKAIVGLSLKNYINLNSEVKKLCEKLCERIGKEDSIDQFLFPSIGTIAQAASSLACSPIAVGAQNISPYESGPYTGEYSIQSLVEAGGKYVELAHYERKKIFHESNGQINQKIRLVLSKKLIPVVCIGEKEVKLSDKQFEKIIAEQLASYFEKVNSEEMAKAILAYEPGWAIGKAEAAGSEYVHHAHSIIRQVIAEMFDENAAAAIRIIYGGSVSVPNSQELVNHKDVDGVFLGRFGHDPQNYQKIVENVKQAKGLS